MEKRNAKKFGVCKLTGTQGPLVKCHILPKSLTRPSINGAPLLQSTRGKGYQRRWSSWYDDSIVTREGEDILASIDDLAIKVLRKHKLLWSSWMPFKPHFESLGISKFGWQFRNLTIPIDEAAALQRFCISLVWRAAVSQLPDMDQVVLEPGLVEQLRGALVSQGRPALTLLPTSLTQLSTIGEIHNHAPYIDEKYQPEMFGIPARTMKIVRLYIDGLIFHCHLNANDLESLEENTMIVGAGEELLVSAIEYERSFQYENLLVLAYESTLGPLGSPIKQTKRKAR